MSDGDRVVAGGDDSVMRVYSLSGGGEIGRFKGHGDAIRSILGSVGSENIVISGSYDHTIRVWNVDCVGGDKAKGQKKVSEVDEELMRSEATINEKR